MRRLQPVQNAAARLITGTLRCDHISPVLRSCTGFQCGSASATRSSRLFIGVCPATSQATADSSVTLASLHSADIQTLVVGRSVTCVNCALETLLLSPSSTPPTWEDITDHYQMLHRYCQYHSLQWRPSQPTWTVNSSIIHSHLYSLVLLTFNILSVYTDHLAILSQSHGSGTVCRLP